jgi:hypothetical protein
MRVRIGDKLAATFPPEQEKAINPYRVQDRVEGVVLSKEAATDAYIRQTKWLYAILCGLALALTLGAGLLAAAVDRAMTYSVIVAANLLLALALHLLLRRRVGQWNATLDARVAGLPAVGTTIVADGAGLTVGTKTHPWPSIEIEQVDLAQFTQQRSTVYFVERLLLAAGAERIALDVGMIGNGRLIVGNSWRRLREGQ